MRIKGENIRRRLGHCLLSFQCVPYGHRRGGGQQSIWEHSSKQGRLCKVGEISLGVSWPAHFNKGLHSLLILQHLDLVVHVVFNFHATEKMVRHITMGRLRDGLSRRI